MNAKTAYYSPATFTFLNELAQNNSREWFAANKARYEAAVREPSLRLIADLAEPLRTISPELVANPKKVGGSLFRIHRDTRFSKDKTPYKTHIGMTFYHAATKAVKRGDQGNAAMGQLDGPVYYLHVAPGACFMGGGIWHPQSETLKRIRNFLINSPNSWKQATRGPAFQRHFELGGDSLTRPPRGYDPDHELIGDLKRKDYVASATLTDADLLRTDLVELLVERYRELAPMLDWLCGALDLEF